MKRKEKCIVCDGTGKLDWRKCPNCNGTGLYEVEVKDNKLNSQGG